MSEKDPEFLIEEWTLYSIGVAVILLRCATRLKMVGIRNFQGDDYFSILTLVVTTIGVANVDIIYYTGTNVEASVIQQFRPLTDAEIDTYTFGSQQQLSAWYAYVGVIWSMKATMLFFLGRLTSGSRQHKYIKWLAYACGLSFGIVVLTLTFGCYPIQKNWQVIPDPGVRCTVKMQNFIATTVLNVVTDAAILAIPMPMLWKLKIALRKKLVIGMLLCSGIFVITAAIIRVVLTLSAHPSALNINRWGMREAIVGVVTINLPIIKPLFGLNFWSRKPNSEFSVYVHNPNPSRAPHELSKIGAMRSKGAQYDEEDCQPVINKASTDRASNSSPGGPGTPMSDNEDFIFHGAGLEKGVTVSTTLDLKSEDVETMEAGMSSPWQERKMGVSSEVTVHAR